MNKKELIRKATAVLREVDARKPVRIPKQVLHISDDEGNHKDFVVKKVDKNVIYTAEDVETILDACQYVIQEALKVGEEVSLRGFGVFGIKYRKPRVVKNVLDDQLIEVDGHYVPSFTSGNDLKRSVQVYAQALADKEINRPLPIFSDEDE